MIKVISDTKVPIKDFNNYFISNIGEIFKLTGNGFIKLKPSKDKDGYFRIRMTKNGKRIEKRIHRLVTETWIGPPLDNNKQWVCHINGINTDNRVENLKWGSPKDNSMDRVKHGNSMFGEKNNTTILDEQTVLKIRNEYISYGFRKNNAVALSEKYGTTKQNIKSIIKRLSWKHIK